MNTKSEATALLNDAALSISKTLEGIQWSGSLTITKDEEGLLQAKSVTQFLRSIVDGAWYTEPCFEPFANESDVLALGTLTCENRTDRVQIYGELDTSDDGGVARLLTVATLIEASTIVLEHEKKKGALPPKIEYVKTDSVQNPFL